MLTQDQIKANIDALQAQGASNTDIQGYLDSLKPTPVKPLSRTDQYLADQPDFKQSLGYKAVSGLAKGIADPFARIGVSTYNLGKSAGDLTGAALGSLVGNQKFARTAFDKANEDLGASRNLPFLGTIKPIQGKLDAIGVGLDAGTNIAAFGGASSAAKTIAEKGLEATLKPGLKAFAKEGLKEGLTYGFPASLGSALQKEDKTPGSVASETIIGTGLSGLLGLGLGLVAGVASKVSDFLNPETAKQNLSTAYREALRPTQSQTQAESRYYKDTPKFLAEESVVGKGIPLEGNGGKLDTKAAVAELQTRYTAENTAFENILKTSGQYNSLDQMEKEWVAAAKEQYSGTDQDWAIQKIQDELAAYRRQYAGSIVTDVNGESIMPSFEFNQLKRDLWGRAKSSFASPNLDKLADDLFFQGGHVAKEQIENVITDANIKGMNQRLGDFASAIKLLQKRDGIPLGRLNRYMARLLGSIIGSGGGALSSFIGALTGDKLAEILQNPEIDIGLKREIYKRLETEGRSSIVDEAQKILEQRGAALQDRKLLTAPTTIYGSEFKGLPESPTAGAPGSFGMQEKATAQGLPDAFVQPRSAAPTQINPDVKTGVPTTVDLRTPAIKETGAPNVTSLSSNRAKPLTNTYNVGISNVAGLKETPSDALFQQAKDLLTQGKVSEAQAKYEESLKYGISQVKKAFKNTGIDINVKPSFGIFAKTAEPSIDMTAKVPIGKEDLFHLKLTDLADTDFAQRSFLTYLNITGESTPYGIINKNTGLANEPFISITLKKPATLADVTKFKALMDKYELPGGSIKTNATALDILNLSHYNADYEKFIKNIIEFTKDLDQQGISGRTYKGMAEVRHLGATREFSGTTYEDFRSHLLQESPNKVGISKKTKVAGPTSLTTKIKPSR